MANGGGNFGGDGSVVWEVSTNKDRVNDSNGKKRKRVEDTHGNEGKTNAGIDADIGQYFVILLKLPANVDLDEFIRDYIERQGDHVKIRLKIEKDSHQIEVHWSPEFAGTTDSVTATR